MKRLAGFLTLMTTVLMSGFAYGGPIFDIEPDDFAVGTDLTSAYPPVILTMEVTCLISSDHSLLEDGVFMLPPSAAG